MKKSLFLLPALMCLWMNIHAQITSVGLIGDATPGGWDVDTNMVQSETDSNIWTLTIVLSDGFAKFRADDAWTINWGSTAFPVGTGVQDGDNIEVDSGEYHIRFNSLSGDYVFARTADVTYVGLIGTAGPFGWDADTAMVQDTADADLWHLTIKLNDGEAKFRADPDWVVNWGNDEFPTGVGYQDGPNIPVFDGVYDITLNAKYGDYSFAVQSDIGVIGDATPAGWDSDINMYQDPADSNKYFITLDLVAGGLKFRQNDDWEVNWGSADFPTGVGVQDGDNIPIPNAGEYQIMFDKSTGAYNFIENVDYQNVGMIGDATANGWDSITYMMKDGTDPNVWTINIDLMDGGLQFVGDSGTIVWGGSGFPTDTAVVDGDTIPVTAGKYIVSFNSSTGVYNFTLVPIYETIGIIGDATPNGWDGEDIDLEKSESDPSVWTLRMDLLDGEAKFRADNDWAVNWGGGDFPSGTATLNGANIPITAGDYLIRFNSFTGEYSFTAIVEYDAISLVGRSGPFGDWPGEDASRDLFLDKDPNDPNHWTTTNVTLTDASLADDGGVKFRADTAWTINWGAEDFPSGTGTQNGPNIQCAAGTFNVDFNSATGEYAFIDPATSSREFLKASEIKLYPNPTTEWINIDLSAVELTGEVQLSVFDLSGKMVLSQRRPVNGLIQLDVNQLKEGNYLLQILNEKVIVGKQFAIAK